MLILGIESSCDETGLALYDTEKGLISQALHSQVDLHADYGGVVPELASRDHVRKITPLTRLVLSEANKSLSDLDGIAYTAGPGLMGALLVGASFAKSLAWSLNIPSIGVHHMEAHLLAPLIEPSNAPELPFMALLVSGGHTQLVHVKALGDYEILGESLDDAAGEAFDKTAKLLGLDYPGGPLLAKLAEKGEPGHYKFPRPMTDRPGLDFSFSGLKTFAANTIRAADDNEQTKANIAYAFQEAVIDTLIIKCKRALKQTGMKRLVIAGGVSANTMLRTQMKTLMDDLRGEVFYPHLAYCTDNGAMIAYAGMQRLKAGEVLGLSSQAKPRWPLDTLAPV